MLMFTFDSEAMPGIQSFFFVIYTPQVNIVSNMKTFGQKQKDELTRRRTVRFKIYIYIDL